MKFLFFFRNPPDEGPVNRGRNHIRGQRRGAHAAGDLARSRSPLRPQETVCWKTEVDPDTHNIHPPRFTPKRCPGVQPVLTTTANQAPGDIFALFFDKEVLKVVCANTNKYVWKKQAMGRRMDRWTDLTPEELKKYLGLLLYMSVCNFPKMSDFWRKKTIFHVAFPATVMSRNRFTVITSNLHMSDPEEDTANEGKRGTEEYDPLQKLKPLLEMIRTRCKSVYHPKQHISIDERMVATKGRLKSNSI